jgi:hypothetical protein
MKGQGTITTEAEVWKIVRNDIAAEMSLTDQTVLITRQTHFSNNINVKKSPSVSTVGPMS